MRSIIKGQLETDNKYVSEYQNNPFLHLLGCPCNDFYFVLIFQNTIAYERVSCTIGPNQLKIGLTIGLFSLYSCKSTAYIFL